MQELAKVTFSLGVVGYSVASTLFFVDLARRDGAGRFARLAPWMLAAGVLSHLLHILLESLVAKTCPVDSMQFALSFTALMASSVFLVVRKKAAFNALGAFVAPASLTLLIGAQFVGRGEVAGSVPPVLLALHVTTNLVGVALFLLAGAAGVFYLVQERRLKARRVGGMLTKLPPLSSLDLTEHRLLLTGFPLLTFGVVSGAVFAGSLAGGSGAALLRAALAYGTWFILAAVLVLRRTLGWSGRRAAYGTVLGVGCVILVIALYVLQPSLGAAP
jgi:ABC-type uncharacterized transport system permease subunit